MEAVARSAGRGRGREASGDAFLSAEVQDVIRSRLAGAAAAAASLLQRSPKARAALLQDRSSRDGARSPERRLEADIAPAAAPAAPAERRGLVDGLLLGRRDLLGRGAGRQWPRCSVRSACARCSTARWSSSSGRVTKLTLQINNPAGSLWNELQQLSALLCKCPT